MGTRSAMRMIETLIGKGVTEKEQLMQETGLTSKQVINALKNLRYAKRIETLESRPAGYMKGKKIALYRVNTNRNKKTKVENTSTQLINSVFALGGLQNESIDLSSDFSVQHGPSRSN